MIYNTQTDSEQHTRHQISHDRGTEQDESTAGERQEKEEWKQRSCHHALHKTAAAHSNS